MKQSKLFTKTSKEIPADADSANARLLIQAGYVDQLAAGIYSFLPLGHRTLEKIKTIVREEMDGIGGQEVTLPGLTPKEPWTVAGRWNDPGKEVMFQLKGRSGKEFGLAFTAEEIITPIVKKFAHSYKDFPIFVYQITDKFRDEPRAKSGLLRGREFSMKDLYSFHLSEEDRAKFYDEIAEAYARVFKRCGIPAVFTEADGGSFGDASHEFQMPTESGEDIIYVNSRKDYAWNKEIVEGMKDGDDAPDGSGTVSELKAIEVGNIFPLGTKFTGPIDFKVTDKEGVEQTVIMGSYGIGPSRVMGAMVEAMHDDKGMIWPKNVAPYQVHLLSLHSKDEEVMERIKSVSHELYDDLIQVGVEVLWDERAETSTGAKFADADLIGLPLRLVVSEKTLRENSVEWKERAENEMNLIKIEAIIEAVQAWVKE